MPAPFDTLAAAAAWYDAWLREAALPLWASAGVDPRGGLFQETSRGGDGNNRSLYAHRDH